MRFLESVTSVAEFPSPSFLPSFPIERAVIRSDNGVLANPFPALDANTVGANPTNGNSVVLLSAEAATFQDSQRALILQALHASGWVVGGPSGAAARLRLKRTTLISKMKKLGILRPADHNDSTHIQEREPGMDSTATHG